MISFKQFVESYKDSISTTIYGLKRSGDVFENPSSKEIRELLQGDQGTLRGVILDDSTVYLVSKNLLHIFIIQHFNLKTFIPIELFFFNYPKSKEVKCFFNRDTIKKGNRYNISNEKILQVIQKNKYLNNEEMFKLKKEEK